MLFYSCHLNVYVPHHALMLYCYVVTLWSSCGRRIKEDDRMIQSEGVDSLSEAELRQACRERGMLGLRSAEDMRKQVYFAITIVFLESFFKSSS